MKSIYIFIIVVVGWVVLNRWVLPKFGISTWMSKTCSLDENAKDKTSKEKFD